MLLRSTLMGFERYYQISIPSNQIIIQTFTSWCTACCCTLYYYFSTFAFAFCSYFYSYNSCLYEAASRGRGKNKNKNKKTKETVINNNKATRKGVQVKSPHQKRCFQTHSNRLFLASKYETQVLPPLESKLDPWFVTGFIDGEGCFGLYAYPNTKKLKNGMLFWTLKLLYIKWQRSIR